MSLRLGLCGQEIAMMYCFCRSCSSSHFLLNGETLIFVVRVWDLRESESENSALVCLEFSLLVGYLVFRQSLDL